MKVHRFFTTFTTEAKTATITDTEIAHQIYRVLRLKPKETIVLCDNSGMSYLIELTEITKTKVSGKILKTEKEQDIPQHLVTLYLSILKRDNFELAVQKAVEVGVSKIVPLLTERTIKTGFRIERAKDIIREACEQSGRSTLPQITEPISLFNTLAELSKEKQTSILFCTLDKEKAQPIQKLLPTLKKNRALFIGPEGGFSKEETILALKNGSILTSLGNTTLRAETAAIIATYTLIS